MRQHDTHHQSEQRSLSRYASSAGDAGRPARDARQDHEPGRTSTHAPQLAETQVCERPCVPSVPKERGVLGRWLRDHEQAARCHEGPAALRGDCGGPKPPGDHDVHSSTQDWVMPCDLGPLGDHGDTVGEAQALHRANQKLRPAAVGLKKDPPCPPLQ